MALLVGEAETLSYDELQHTLGRLIHGEDWETIEIPAPLAPFAKVGAWVQEKLPGRDPFIRPWMIDRANDHYALDITRARTLLGLGADPLTARHAPQDGRGAQSGPARLVPRQRAGAARFDARARDRS